MRLKGLRNCWFWVCGVDWTSKPGVPPRTPAVRVEAFRRSHLLFLELWFGCGLCALSQARRAIGRVEHSHGRGKRPASLLGDALCQSLVNAGLRGDPMRQSWPLSLPFPDVKSGEDLSPQEVEG